MPANRIRTLILSAPCLALLVADCAHPSVLSRGGGGGPGGGPPPATDACLLPTGDVATRASAVTIALAEPVDPHHAPVPRNDAERVVFRHLYEAPVRLDCQGHVISALAEEWVRDDGGRRWTFRLRDGAQFWDGAPVTAQDVVFGRSPVGYTLGALETRVVTVMLARPRDEVPPLLADPGLAVTKPAPDSSWPIGTGRFWATSGTTTPQEIRALSPTGDTLIFRLFSSLGGDARDLLDAGVDLLVTRDRALRDYAGTQATRFAVLALPWDRTYALVTPELGGNRFDGLQDAVRAEARRAEGPFWWLDLRGCGLPPQPAPPPALGTGRTIMYPRSDPTARDLAGRLAALTHGVAVARGAQEFADAFKEGRAWGYVMPLPIQAADPCRAARELLPPWAATVTALVDTRATAIVRRGVARWTVDQDGTVRLAP